MFKQKVFDDIQLILYLLSVSDLYLYNRIVIYLKTWLYQWNLL